LQGRGNRGKTDQGDLQSSSQGRGGGRGRGRGDRGRGGRGRGRGNQASESNSKGPSKPTLAEDDECDLMEDLEIEDEEDFEDIDDEGGEIVQGKNGEVVKPEKRKVEMQVLHMSQESQTRIEAALSELRGGKYKLRDAKSYKDGGIR